MGWTHHWRRGTELPQTAFAAAVRDCRKVILSTGIPLGGFDGTGEALFRDNAIVFNGAGRTGCEPFEVHRVEFDRRGRKVSWSFCKTESAPYNLCVMTALIVLNHHLGDAIRIASDGKDGDWAKAREICRECLGYGDSFRVESGAD